MPKLKLFFIIEFYEYFIMTQYDYQEILQKAKKLELENKSRQAGVVLMEFIEKSFCEQNFNFIENLLEEFDPFESYWSSYSYMAIIRSTSRAKQKLLNWLPLLEKIKQAMLLKNMPADKLLIGII